MKRIGALGLCLAILTACGTTEPEDARPVASAPKPEPAASDTLVGSYLAGRFARASRDVRAAADFYARALAEDPDNQQLLRRTFFLMVSDGRVEEAMELGSRIESESERSGVVSLVMALGHFKNDEFLSVLARLRSMRLTGFNTLLVPLITAWTHAAQNQMEAAEAALEVLSQTKSFNPIRAYHAALIHDLAGNHAAAEKEFSKAMKASPGGTLRVVSAFGAFLRRADRVEEARKLYRVYLSHTPRSRVVSEALARLERGEEPAYVVSGAAGGVAEALFDVASSLARNNARDASRSYVQLALYIRPDMGLGRMLLGELFESERRWDEASAAYRDIDPSSPFGWNARLRMASALDRLDRTDEAATMLREMAGSESTRTDALILLADILRGRERYGEAVVAYDQAFGRITSLEERHWSLLYARGIALERSEQWARAEADFEHALELKPNQPLVLNYLGYSWVEKKTNLDRALKMIEKAVKLRPNDGYIVDSLGWVYYRLGSYEKAVAQLERAVELRPQDPTINDHLGDAYWRVGRFMEARFQWRRVLSFEPEEGLIPVIESKLEAGLAPPGAVNEGS